jgi:hypothetical protein
MMKVMYLKITHRNDAEFPLESYQQKLLEYTKTWHVGHVSAYPEIGKCVWIYDKEIENILTSQIRDVCEVGSAKDKLVLPPGFPTDQDLNNVKLEDGDILIATSNSIYLFRRIPDDDERTKV